MKAVALAIVLAAGLPASAARLTITAEATYPAVMVVDGRVLGHAADKVHEIMRRAGIDYTLDVMPWKRAYISARNQPDTCVFMTTRTPEREAQFRWVGPISQADWVLYGRAGRDYGIKVLEDARPLRIGAYNGDIRGEHLARLGFKVDFVQNDESNPRKLMLDRIDLWVNSTRSSRPMLARADLADKIVPVLTFNNVRLYLACNPATPAALAERMDAALKAMVADGAYKAIEQKYEHLQIPASARK
ncbi:MAG: ABC transporter substrate-binding protein [Pseudomonadota bacterium]